MAVIGGRGPAFLRGVNLSSMDLSGAGWLIEADLRGANLSSTNLKGALLRGADLEKANLHSANLMGTNLEAANLLEVKADMANLSRANLRGANLKGANLVSADLMRADLMEADLEGADLEGANLRGCNLTRARITNVNLKMTNLEGANLTEAIINPLSGDAMPEEEESGDFHGTITAIKLTDLIQIGCLSRSNLNIEIYCESAQGNIYVGSGRVLHAHTAGIEGEEAFMKILGWEKGRFITLPFIPSGPVTIDKPVEHLVLQWLRIKDEKKFTGQYTGLIRRIKEYMPLQAMASGDLVEFFEKGGKNLDPAERIEITDVFHPDDGEEILCSISANGEALIAPLKFLSLDSSHPLHGELAGMK